MVVQQGVLSGHHEQPEEEETRLRYDEHEILHNEVSHRFLRFRSSPSSQTAEPNFN